INQAARESFIRSLVQESQQYRLTQAPPVRTFLDAVGPKTPSPGPPAPPSRLRTEDAPAPGSSASAPFIWATAQKDQEVREEFRRKNEVSLLRPRDERIQSSDLPSGYYGFAVGLGSGTGNVFRQERNESFEVHAPKQSARLIIGFVEDETARAMRQQ